VAIPRKHAIHAKVDLLVVKLGNLFLAAEAHDTGCRCDGGRHTGAGAVRLSELNGNLLTCIIRCVLLATVVQIG
jgi:hypothetical protein